MVACFCAKAILTESGERWTRRRVCTGYHFTAPLMRYSACATPLGPFSPVSTRVSSHTPLYCILSVIIPVIAIQEHSSPVLLRPLWQPCGVGLRSLLYITC